MVVDHDHVRFEVQRFRVPLVDLPEGLVHVLGDLLVSSLQGVGEPLHDRKELLRSRNDLPTRLHAQRRHHRHQAPQELRRPSTIPNRTHMHDASPLDQVAQPIQKVDRSLWRHFPVVIERGIHSSAFLRSLFLSTRVKSRSIRCYKCCPRLGLPAG